MEMKNKLIDLMNSRASMLDGGIKASSIPTLAGEVEELFKPTPDKIATWGFYYEETPFNIIFEIEALCQEDAYNIAYNYHGPSVKDMMYKIVK